MAAWSGSGLMRSGRRGLLALLGVALTAAVLVGVAVALPAGAQSGIVTAAPTAYEIVGSYPHDPDAFLQGLVWHDGGFYESTGLYGKSTLRRVAFPSGEVLKSVSLDKEFFGEGLALVEDRLIQLTWRSKRAFIYDRESFALVGEFPYETEGWGLAYDGASLILSDGSDTLFFYDPQTYQQTRSLKVTLDGRPLKDLNELEYIRGEVWANVWHTDIIVRIDPASGQVIGVLDLAGILQNTRRDNDDVLNGIAYDPATDRIFVSGKRWPLLFEIRVP